MPKDGISIYFTIQDGATSTLKAIGDQTKALDKETQSLQQSAAALAAANKPLIERQAELKTALEKSTANVKEAKKAFRAFGEEALEAWDLSGAIEEQESLKRELQDVESQIKSNQKAFNEYREDVRKGAVESGNGKNGGSIAGDSSTISSLKNGLMSSGLLEQLASTAGSLGASYLTSAIGTPEASALTETFSGMLSGMAAGAIAGPLGALLGAGAGSISGLLTAQSQIFEAKDDEFKSYYQEQYETALDDQSGVISSGSTIAGGREQTRMAFAQRLGSEAAADAYLEQVKTMATRTNYDYDEITGYSKLLLNSYEADETLGILQTLSDATAGLNLSSSDVNMMISGLSRMRTTGKATAEYLNYFRERGVDADEALAEYLGVDKSGIADMVSKSKISGVDAAQAILDYIDQEFGGLSDKLAGTYDAMVDNLADAESNLQAIAGEAYNQERAKGVGEQTNWLEENESELGGAYAMIGQWQASLENTKEQLEREALEAVMKGVISESYRNSEQGERLEEMSREYQKLLEDYEGGSSEAGAKMGALLAEAQVIAANEYNASDGAQLALQSQLDLAAQIREDTASNDAFWDAGYIKGQEFSKGLAAGMLDKVKEVISPVATDQNALSGSEFDLSGYDQDELQTAMETGMLDYYLANASPHAYGLNRVPYDGYPAMLHEGERVLTAQEARAQDDGGQQVVQITLTGNNFVGTGEEMADQIAEILARKLEQAAVAAVPR